MSATTDMEAVKRKLRAILAKTGADSGTTEEEAAAALAFARRLMLAHSISEEDLRAHGARGAHERAADEEYAQRRAAATGSVLAAWEGDLGSVIAALVGSVGVYCPPPQQARTATGSLAFDGRGRPKRQAGVMFYGPRGDVQMATELFEEWRLTVLGLARMRTGSALRGDGAWYARGFVQGMHDQLTAMRSEERALVAADSTALVAVQTGLMEARRAHADVWLRGQGVRLATHTTRASARSASAADNYGAGRADGRRADLGARGGRRAIQ